MILPKNYQPKEYEDDIYKLWEKSGAFKPIGNSLNYFSVAMPPPNANASPHLGTLLTIALEDIAIRYHRLKGYNTLFVPGADHAGFETWVVYENKLNQEGKTRFDFTRDELYAQVWDFVQLNKDSLIQQFKSMGMSSDWDRFSFTLDEKVVKTAYATFRQMWHDKLIYRGERLVNYCTFHGTSFSDIEVVYKKEQGKLWYIRYPLTNGEESIVIATTRPETMLGDSAVAVNSADKRYTKFIGKTVKLPLTNREVPIVGDEMVDPDFGTGAVKITPAHDQNDFEVAERHSLPLISVINTKGRMADSVPERYRELTVDAARKLIIQDLEEMGHLVKVEHHSNRVGHCYKCDTVIQPLLREQWFVSMKPLADKAIKVLEAGKIKFYPASKLNQSIEYLKNIKDWNISRQIAWGIPIPAFQNVDDPSDWIYDENVNQETTVINGKTYRRDPDVFDTWFSSGQWPYVTLNYPDGADFKDFYPLSLMETGGEILYQWVCRMIVLGLYVTDDIPFKEVYIHGYVMAEDGSKMSKSRGNVIDHKPIMEQYGADALRMGLISGRSPAVNRGFDIRRVEEAKNFANKLWNIARFSEANIGDSFEFQSNPKSVSIQDEWILLKLYEASREVTQNLDKYRFSEAYDIIYHLVWDNFADWYIESSKYKLNKSVLSFGLESILKLAHPFAPFVTETIWQTLKWEGKTLLINSSWPDIKTPDKHKAQAFEKVISVVNEIRFIKATLGLHNKVRLIYLGNDFLKDHGELICSLTSLASVQEDSLSKGLELNTVENSRLVLEDKQIRHFLDELTKQIKTFEEKSTQLKLRLENKAYIDNAPKTIVLETRNQLKDTENNLKKARTQYEHFNAKR